MLLVGPGCPYNTVGGLRVVDLCDKDHNRAHAARPYVCCQKAKDLAEVDFIYVYIYTHDYSVFVHIFRAWRDNFERYNGFCGWIAKS